MWAGLFKKDPAVKRSVVAQAEKRAVAKALPCDMTFVDTRAGGSEDLLGDLCIVQGMGQNQFRPNSNVSRGAVAKMVAGAMMYAYVGNAILPAVDDASAVYADVPVGLRPYVAQLQKWGLLQHIARNGKTFGTNDVMKTEEITSFLNKAIASLPETIATSDRVTLPLGTESIARGTFADMVVQAFQLQDRVRSSALAMNR